MAKIIEFKKKETKVSDAERYKALSKGEVRIFTCDICGEEFEVINGKFPKSCPGCGLEFESFNKLEENI